MKHAGPLFLAFGMLLSSTAGAAPHGGANEIWEDDTGSVEAMPVDPTSGSLDWQSLGSSGLDDRSDDVLLTPTLDQFLESLDGPGLVDGSQLPERPDGTVSDPMDLGTGSGAMGAFKGESLDCDCDGHDNDRGNGHCHHGNGNGYGHDKDKDKDNNGNDRDDTPAGPVPEPSTLLLAGASALAFGARKRFRSWRRKGQENATDA